MIALNSSICRRVFFYCVRKPLFALTLTPLLLLNASAGQLAKLTIKPEKGDREGFSLLSWPSTPGLIYRVQKSTDLGNNVNWLFGDARVAESNVTQVEIPSGFTAEFYRLMAMPEIFSVEPMWVDATDPESGLYIMGQFLPTNATVVINGHNLSPIVQNTDGVWAFVSLNTLTPGESLTGVLSVIDNDTGTTAATYKLQSGFIYATAPQASSSPRLMAPPTSPPASPVSKYGGGVKRWRPTTNVGGRMNSQPTFTPATPGSYAFDLICDEGGDCDDNDPTICPSAMKVKEKGNRTKCSNNLRMMSPSTGELQAEETDLVIPGRGLDFVWTRTYRSRTGSNTPQGNGWDFSYNVSLSQQPDGTIQICMGNGRCDTFYPNGTNGWACDEYFVQVRDLDADGMPDVLFADTGKWLFNAFDGANPAGGKLKSIIDRNGNTLSLSYDSSGRLSSIADTLGRTNLVSYNSSGRIESVTDFTGRVVRYEYDTNGDLIACVSPVVVGTPTKNDFPGGKTNRYTYTSGFTDERLNHNLTACIDAKGQMSLRVTYQPTNNASSMDFDAVATLQRGIERKDVMRGMVKPTPNNRFAVTQTIVNDYVGNVTEYFFDSRHRCVCRRDYTGRANPLLPTTTTDNRPTGKLRSTDPDYFETLWTWNADSLCTSETLPGGQRTFFVYERDFDSSVLPCHKGDLRVLRQVACCRDMDSDGDGLADYQERSWYFEHDPRFGSDPLVLGGIVPAVSNHAINTKGAGSNAGKLVPTPSQHAINTKGTGGTGNRIVPTVTAHAINTKGAGSNAGRIVGAGSTPFCSDEPSLQESSGMRTRIDELENRLQAFGLLGRFAAGPRQTTSQDGSFSHGTSGKRSANGDNLLLGKTDADLAVGAFVTSVTDPRGNTCTATYDSNGNCTVVNPRAARDNHLQGAMDVIQTLRLGYNSHGQLTAVTNIADANNYCRVDTLTYDSSGPQTGQLRKFIVDATGPVIEITALEHDERGNVTRLIDPRTNDWLFVYNALDQCVRCETPTNVTARCATEFVYDANDNVVQSNVEVRDENDNKVAGHCVLIGHDYDDRVASIVEQVSATQFVTNQFAYDGNDNVTSVSSPLASSGVDPHNVVTFQYDERDLLYRCVCAPGTTDQNTDQFDYTPNGKIGNYAGGTDTATRFTLYTYDGFDRCIAVTDPMGNVRRCAYDRNDNVVFRRTEAELLDVPGGAGNVRCAQSSYKYDLLNRCVQATTAFFDPATQSPISSGSSSSSFTYAPNGQLISITDGRGNTTACTYDTVGRLASVTDPKLSSVTFGYDTCDNVITVTENDRSDVTSTYRQYVTVRGYDKLHRLTRCTDNIGNTEQFSYDSLDNLVVCTDAKGITTHSEYDWVGHKLKLWVDSNADGTMSSGELRGLCMWDDNGRLASRADANTNSTSYTYDSRDRCIAVAEADGTSCSLVWSPRSNLLRQQDANGTVISNSFDLLDRCVRRDITPAPNVATTTTFEEFSYDGLSRCVSASNNVSHAQFSYDSIGNCVRQIQDGWQMLSAFDNNGNRSSVTYPDGSTVTYTYDGLDQPLTVARTPIVDGAPPVIIASFSYDGPDRVSRITRPNGISTYVRWDGVANPPNATGDYGCQQVSGISHEVTLTGEVVDRRACSYDVNQNKILRAQLVPFGATGEMTTNVFDYDALNQLRMAIKTKGTGAQYDEYVLDPNGNRLTVLSNGVPQPYVMQSSSPPADFQMNQYTLTPYGFQTFDDNGSLISRSSSGSDLHYHYDYANRLISVEDMSTGLAAPVVSFSYDALGRRISKTSYPPAPSLPITTSFVYDGGDVIEMHQGSSEIASFVLDGTRSHDDGAVRTFGWTQVSGPFKFSSTTGALCMRTGGQDFYFHSDEMDNALALTDASGNVVERYDYDDFGTPQFLAPSGGFLTSTDGIPANQSLVGNPFLFQGMEWDSETQLYFEKGWPVRYEGPRFYDAATGRYILRAGVPLRCDPALGRTFSGNNPWTLKKEEGGRHTPFHNKASYGGQTGIGHPQFSAKVPRTVLKSFFQTGDVPTADQFRKILDYGEAGDNASGFLEVTVGGVVLTPRMRVCTCPVGYW